MNCNPTVCTWEMLCRPPDLKSKAWRVRGRLSFFFWLLEVTSILWPLHLPPSLYEDRRVMYGMSPIGTRALGQTLIFASWTAKQDKLTHPVGHSVLSTQPGMQDVTEVFVNWLDALNTKRLQLPLFSVQPQKYVGSLADTLQVEQKPEGIFFPKV